MLVFHPLPQACSILGRRCQDLLYQTTEGYADSHRAPPERNKEALVGKVEQLAFLLVSHLRLFGDETLVVNVPAFA